MANKETAQAIIREIGGHENIEHLTNCATRLRFTLKDATIVDKAKIEAIPDVLAGVPQSEKAFQVVIGPTVEDMRKTIEEIIKSGDFGSSASSNKTFKEDTRTDEEVKAEQRSKVRGKTKWIDAFFEYLSDSFRPMIGVLLAASLIMAAINIFIAFGVISNDTENPSVMFCKAICQSVFTFIGVFVAYNACKKLKVDPWIGVVVMLIVLSPHFMALDNPEKYADLFSDAAGIDAINNAQGIHDVDWLDSLGINRAITIFGVPMLISDYSGNVIVPLLMAPVLAVIYKFVKRILPASLHLIFVPVICIFLTTLLTAFILGPLGVVCGSAIGNGFLWLNNRAPLLMIFVIPLVYPWLVPLGLHWPLNTLMLANINILGYDFIQAPMAIYDYSCYGASFGALIIALREDNARMKGIAGGAVASGFLGGISEPSIYGIHLRYKKSWALMMIGCAAGAIAIAVLGTLFPSSEGVVGITTKVFAFVSLFTIPVFDQMWVYALCIAIAFTTAAVLVVVFDYRTKEQKLQMRAANAAEKAGIVDVMEYMGLPEDQRKAIGKSKTAIDESSPSIKVELTAPIKGRTISLKETKDSAFNKNVLGEGIAIVPLENKDNATDILSPVSGTVRSIAKTNHAVTLSTDDGVSVLVHVGTNTVNMKGEGFKSFVRDGQNVKQGDKLLSANFAKIIENKCGNPVVVTIMNTMHMKHVSPVDYNNNVEIGDKIIDVDL